MKTLQFYGSSDDNFCVEGGGHDDEINNCADGSTMAYTVKHGGEGLIVTGQYAPESIPGVWTIGVAPLDEDVPLPEWVIRFSLAERGYSSMLTIEVPDGAEVLSHGEKDDDE